MIHRPHNPMRSLVFLVCSSARWKKLDKKIWQPRNAKTRKKSDCYRKQRYILYSLWQLEYVLLIDLIVQLRKRTIDRKSSKEAMLNRVSKGLTIGNGQNGGSNGCHVNGDKGEFDDLISALRAGDVFGEDLVKMRRNRRRANGSPHRISQTSNSSVRDSRENSRERALNRKWNVNWSQLVGELRVGCLSLC